MCFTPALTVGYIFNLLDYGTLDADVHSAPRGCVRSNTQQFRTALPGGNPEARDKCRCLYWNWYALTSGFNRPMETWHCHVSFSRLEPVKVLCCSRGKFQRRVETGSNVIKRYNRSPCRTKRSPSALAEH